VEKHNISRLAELGAQGLPTAVLKFWQMVKTDRSNNNSNNNSDTHSNSSYPRAGSRKDGSHSPSALDSQSVASNTSGKGHSSKVKRLGQQTLRFEPTNAVSSLRSTPSHLEVIDVEADSNLLKEEKK